MRSDNISLCSPTSLWVYVLLGLMLLFFLLRSQSLTMAFLLNPPPSASSSECSTRTTTGRCSWRRSTRSSSRSGRGQRKRELRREIRSIGSLHQTAMMELMPRSLTASRREMKMESSLSSPRLAWCLPRSSLLQENMTFSQWVVPGLRPVLSPSLIVSQWAVNVYNRCLFIVLLFYLPLPLK